MPPVFQFSDDNEKSPRAEKKNTDKHLLQRGRPVYLDGLPHLAGKSFVAQKIEPDVKRIIEELK